MAADEECPGLAPESSSSSSVAVIKPEEVSHELIIQNYSSRKKGIGINESIDSDPFMVGGYMWVISFFPMGKTADIYRLGYSSLCLSLKSNVSHRVPCLFEILLLDQSAKGTHQGLYLSKNKYPPNITYCTSGEVLRIYFFAKRDSLYKPYNYVIDNCLKIRCTIRFLNSHILKLPLNKFPAPNTGIEFQKLVQTEGKNNPDVFFEVSGEKFLTHRAILAVHSPVFRSRPQPRCQEIVLPDTETTIFKALLWYVYTATLLEEEEEAWYDSTEFVFDMGKMLEAADELGLERLKEIYESRIVERVSVDSVAYLLDLAEHCHATELKATCLRFIAENQDVVLETNRVRYLKEACCLELTEKPSTSTGVRNVKKACHLQLDGYTEKPSTLEETCGIELAGYTEKPSTLKETCCIELGDYTKKSSSLKETCRIELAGYTEKPSTCRERELDPRTKIATVMKGCFGGMRSPYAYNKLKEA